MTHAGSPLEDRGSISRPLSGARYQTSTDPPVFVVTASGFVGPAVLRDVLAQLDMFGAAHPDGWTYVADVRKVVAPSVRNLGYLRRIHGAPNLERYVVVASLLGRIVLAVARRVPGGPDDVVATIEEALAGGEHEP